MFTDPDHIHTEHDGLPSPDLFRQTGGSVRYEIDRAGAICGIAGAAIAFVLGTISLVVGYVVQTASALNPIGTALLLSIIPLVFAGAVFLDRLEDDLRAAEARPAIEAPASHEDESEDSRLSASARGGLQCST
jgi:hypothetical protein